MLSRKEENDSRNCFTGDSFVHSFCFEGRRRRPEPQRRPWRFPRLIFKSPVLKKTGLFYPQLTSFFSNTIMLLDPATCSALKGCIPDGGLETNFGRGSILGAIQARVQMMRAWEEGRSIWG